MNRREALKTIGISAGYLAVTPALISILQSCQKEIVLNWTPELLSMDEAKVLDRIVDLIIPETDIPGAKTLNIPMFIDKYINQVSKKRDHQFFKYGAEMLHKQLTIDEEKLVDMVTTEEYDNLLTRYLRSPKKKQKEYREQIYQIESLEALKSFSQEVIVFNYLTTVRDLSIYGYKTSEHIGKNVLEYLPVPGEYIGCDSLEKLTGGKAWS